MFAPGTITAFPTDTSFGLGVRCDDREGLQALAELKGRPEGKPFSLMVRGEEMLGEWAYLPLFDKFQDPCPKVQSKDQNAMGKANSQKLIANSSCSSWEDWFLEKPRTGIFRPKEGLPRSPFWPEEGVAFRICMMEHLKPFIEVPITATSANRSGEEAIFDVETLKKVFGDKVVIDETFKSLVKRDPSEIWDFRGEESVRIR